MLQDRELWKRLFNVSIQLNYYRQAIYCLDNVSVPCSPAWHAASLLRCEQAGSTCQGPPQPVCAKGCMLCTCEAAPPGGHRITMAGLPPACGAVACCLTACTCLLDCKRAAQVLARWPEDAGARWDRAVLYGELREPRKVGCMH